MTNLKFIKIGDQRIRLSTIIDYGIGITDNYRDKPRTEYLIKAHREEIERSRARERIIDNSINIFQIVADREYENKNFRDHYTTKYLFIKTNQGNHYTFNEDEYDIQKLILEIDEAI